jgi:hypothetical protein
MATQNKPYSTMTDDEIIHLMNSCSTLRQIMDMANNFNRRGLNTRLKKVDPIELKKFQDKHKSIYRRMSIAELADMVKNSKTLTEILNKLKLSNKGNTGRCLVEYLLENTIDLTHWNLPSLKSKPLVTQAQSMDKKNLPNPNKKIVLKSNITSAPNNDTLEFNPQIVCMTHYLDLLRKIQISLLKQSNYISSLQTLPVPLCENILEETYSNLLNAEHLLENSVPQLVVKYESNRINKTNDKQKPLTELLRENSTCATNVLKKRLVVCNYFINKCAICLMEPIWNGLPIEFEMDHINGIRSDNRIENLRLLCGNCHRQTPTYGSKNLTYQKLMSGEAENKINMCISCEKEPATNGRQCSDCTPYFNKDERPTFKQLVDAVLVTNYANTARVFNVGSDATIKAWIKSYLDYPDRMAHNLPYLNVVRQLKQLSKEKYGDQLEISQPTIDLKPVSKIKSKKLPLLNNGKKTCQMCDKEGIHGNYCLNCAPIAQRTCERPPVNEIMKEVIATNYVATGKKYGVSNKTIKDWIIAYGFKAPKVQELSQHRKKHGKDVDFPLQSLDTDEPT